jgi:hypothetical protein
MAVMTETIGGKEFEIGKLNVFQQAHIGRRLLPFMAALVGTIKEFTDKRGGDEDLPIDFFDLASGPLAGTLAEMPDKDFDFILNTCLSVCRIRQGDVGWAPLATSGGQLMFNDLDLMTMLAIVGAVVRENLGGFFATGQPT